MKTSLFCFFIAISMSSFSQDDHYILYKNGEVFEKQIYYLHEKDFEKLVNEKNNIFFLTKNSKFVYKERKHGFTKVNTKQIDTIEITKPEALYNLEKKEFQEKADLIEREKGFRPIPPINHSILKILIIKQESSDCYFIYEVDWLI